MPRTLLCILLLTLLVLSGCGGPTYVVEKYAGPRRSADSVAILRFRGADDAKLVTVDGERADVQLAEDARLHVEILPGEHRVGVVNAADLQGPLQVVAFRAEAGKVYRVVFGEGRGGAAKVYEVDASDAPVRDVTRAATPEPPSGPPAAEPQPSPVQAAPPADPLDAAARWMDAAMRDQLDATMELSGIPFSWDGKELIESRDELRSRLGEAMQERDHSKKIARAPELLRPTAEELKARYRGDDPVQVVRFLIDDEAVLVFVRTKDSKIVGFAD